MDAAWTGRTKIWLVFTLLIAAVMVFGHGLGGNTLQRLGQLVVAGTAVVFLLCCRMPHTFALVDRPARLACGLVLLAGIVSSLYAHQPLWALTEVALVAACCCCAEAFAHSRRSNGASVDRLLMLFVVFICAFKSFDFLTSAFHSFSAGTGILD